MPMDSVLQVTKKQDANGTTTSLDNHSPELETRAQNTGDGANKAWTAPAKPD